MKRRKFLHDTGWIAAGSCLLPGLLHSCKKSNWEAEGLFQGHVIIVGAGLTGLYAAEILIKQGVSVQILEASSSWGGRLYALPSNTEARRAIERRTLHGEFNILYDLFRHNNLDLIEKSGSELYYFAGRLNNESEANQNTFFEEMLQAIEGLKNYNGADISAEAYFDSMGISTNVESVYNVLTAQERGTSADRISAAGISRQHRLWSSGNSEYSVSGAHLKTAIQGGLSNAIGVVQYNTAVTSIDYSGATITVQDATGANYSCDRLILTVPIDVLQRGIISFNPTLNSAKLNSVNRIGIDMSYCALFKLENALWPSGTRRIIGNDIVQSFEVTDDGWIYAEVSGSQAETISSIFGDPLNIIQHQFDQLYPGAMNQITEGAIHQWVGNRSYDPPGIGDARNILATTVSNKLFFAGEATHTGGHHGTMHGAMETALRAVTEIMNGSTS
jgi:monoamine oxidase